MQQSQEPAAPADSGFFSSGDIVKRYGFLASWIPSLLLLASGWLAQSTGAGGWLWLLTAAAYIGIPVVDLLIGHDNTNPSPAARQTLQTDRFYVRILFISVFLHWAAFLYMAYIVANLPISWFYLAGGMLSAGICNGFSIVAGHELGHKILDRRQTTAARVLLACSGFGHYTLNHNVDHHRWVATPRDYSSARMGESIYRFFPREVLGTFRSTWSLEAARMRRAGRRVWSPANATLQSAVITLVVYSALIVIFGPIMVAYLAVSALFAWWLLSCASYVEHYGLLRQEDAQGEYEPCEVRHSWNSNYLFSNLMTLQVQRHSDHHMHPTWPYPLLRMDESMPLLPQGYPSMFLLAMVPPLWFAVVDPLLLKWAGNDLEKINLDPRKRQRLVAKYAPVGSR